LKTKENYCSAILKDLDTANQNVDRINKENMELKKKYENVNI
jgi:hypothetical protein